MFHSKSFFILLALCSVSVFTSGNSTKYEGCTQLSEDGKCIECFERKLLPNGQGCGPKQPKNNTCEIYHYSRLINQSYCAGCKPGYSNKEQPIGRRLNTTCIKGIIPGCLYESYLPVSETPGHFCSACANNTYSFFNKTTFTSRCAKTSNPVPHCRWGSYVNSAGPTCFLCEDGFTLKLLTHKCIPAVQEGCWYSAYGECRGCNPFSGYSVGRDGKCFKSGQNSTHVDLAKGFKGRWWMDLFLLLNLN